MSTSCSELITQVKAGRLSRRGFVQTMVGLGLTAPMAAQMLASAGRGPGAVEAGVQADQARRRRSAQDALVAGRDPAQPALRRRHQGPGRLAHLLRAAGLVGSGRQPLARPRRRDPDRAERRRRQGRQVGDVEAQEGRAVARRQALHRRRRASSTGSTRPTPPPPPTDIGTYKDIKVEKVDSHTVRVTFPKPTPFWADAFCGVRGMIIPKHVFEPFKGGKSREAPANLKPVGTGPYRFVDFKPGDMVEGELNPTYHMPNRPVLRHHRDEGRRRRGLGGAGRHPDGRVRLRLEHAGRGRDPQAHGAGRQGQGRHRGGRRHRAHPAATSPTRGRKWTASGPASRPSIPSCPIPPSVRR